MTPEPHGALLHLRDVSISFGGLRAVDGVDLEVRRGEIVGLIGPNGAGKTTLFNIVTRLYTPDRGELRFDGEDLLRLARHQVIARGIARTFQNLVLFNQLSVLDNVLVGLHSRMGAGLVACAFRLRRVRREDEEMRARGAAALAIVGLGAVADQPARNLSFGHQRLLELARGLASGPKLLLLDEPGAGLSAQELDALTAVIGRIRDTQGATILLIGHTMRLVLGISDRVVVLDHGVKIAEGAPREIRTTPAVVRAYLGEPEAGAQA
jgi:ABC-type branched-subunit amino acid transport system ATPase component